MVGLREMMNNSLAESPVGRKRFRDEDVRRARLGDFQAFRDVHHAGVSLGVDEFQDALQVILHGWRLEGVAGMGRDHGRRRFFVKKTEYWLLTDYEIFLKKLGIANFDAAT
jgi:hypothetical protein